MSSALLMLIILTITFSLLASARSRRSQIGQNYPPQQLGSYPQQFTGYPQQPFGAAGGGWSQLGMPLQQNNYDPMAHQPITQASREAVDRDITTFGGELRDLDLEVVGRELDAAAQADYTLALDAYDGAKHQLATAKTNADIRRISEIMEEGRYAVACVKARVVGQAVPERRPPCFFDPAHGVSATDVVWAPPGGASRSVPACAADAQRIRLGNDPSIRMVHAQQGQVPYWEDQSYSAWAQGYYGRYSMDPTMRSITQGALMIGGFSLLMGLLDD